MTMSSKRAWYADYTLQVRDPFAGLSPRLVALVKGELTEGEEILWMEQPDPGFLFRARFPYFLYSYLGAGVLSLLPRLLFSKETIDWSSYALGGVGLLVGAALTWLFTAIIAKRTLYMLTNHRLIYFNSIILSSKKATSYYFNYQIKSEYIQLKKRSKGRSDLSFARGNSNGLASEGKFYGIRRAHLVQQLIVERLAQNTENLIADLPIKLQQILKAELAPGENALWASLSDPYTVKNQESNRWGLSKVGLYAGLLMAAAGCATLVAGLVSNNNYIWPGVFLLVLSMLLLGWSLVQSFKKTVNYNATPGYNAYLITGQRILQIAVEGSEQEEINTYYYAQASVPPRIVKTIRTANTADLHLQDNLSRPIPRTIFSLIDVSEPDKAEQLLKQLTTSGTL